MKMLVLGLIVGMLALFGCASPAPEQPPAPPPSGGGPVGGGEVPPAPPEEPPTAPVSPPMNNSTATPPAPPEPSGINAAELSLHNTEADCWIAYKGKVYDVTSYVPKHPGGKETIVPLCGTAGNFETAFNNKHGTSKDGMLVSQSMLKGDYAG